MRCIGHFAAKIYFFALPALLLLAGCGGSGGTLADGGITGTGIIIGTVPGTVIEAYGEDGDYKETFSKIVNSASDKHPFLLRLPSGIGYYLVMIINEGTENEIVMPIAFPGNKPGEVLARIILREGDVIDLGHVPLFLDCSEVPLEDDSDGDCILDKPFILNEDEGSYNPLRQMDADADGEDDYDDPDHGYGHGGIFKDPQDHDDDRVPNKYDDDFERGSNDKDDDGIDDDEDKNPGNIPKEVEDSDDDSELDWNGQGMHPSGQTWFDQHGDYAEHNLENCAACHGDDFRGTSLSAQVGCYDCHDGPAAEEDDSDDDSQPEWNGQGMHSSGMAWLEQHGDYAEHNLDNCAACHGDDFLGTPLSAQVGCFDCHDGPGAEEDDSDDDSQPEWNGQGMHPSGMAWREHHGDYAEHNLDNCAACHGDDFLGTPLSAQVGCFDCHDGPEPEDD